VRLAEGGVRGASLAYMRLNPQVPASVKQIVFVLNTGDFENTASSWACEWTHPRTKPVLALLQAAGATRLVHVLQDKRWGVGWYKDGIHPTAAGFGVLAGIIRDDLDRLHTVGM